MNRFFAYILFVLFIWFLASCSSSDHNFAMEQYNKDSDYCLNSGIDYHDCMHSRGWVDPAPNPNPYDNQLPGK